MSVLEAEAPLSPSEQVAYDAEAADAKMRGLPPPLIADFRARHPEKTRVGAKEREAIGYQVGAMDAAEAALRSAIDSVIIERGDWMLAARLENGPMVILFDAGRRVRSTPDQVQAAIKLLQG